MTSRPICATPIMLTRWLTSGEMIEAARCQMGGGQTVGMGWLAVRINYGEWVDVDFSSHLHLVRTIEACETFNEFYGHVLSGSQWPPFTRDDTHSARNEHGIDDRPDRVR